MTTPIPEPPAGTGVIAGPQMFQYPPLVPGIATTNPPNVTAPAVPASGSVATNTTGVDVAVYAAAGAATVSKVQVNGGTLGTTLATSTGALIAYLPAGQPIILTYSGGTPTWVWQAV